MEQLLKKSEQFARRILQHQSSYMYGTNRDKLVAIMADISFQHAKSMLKLFDHELNNTAVSILRMQFEAVVRLMWLHFTATDSFIEKYAGPIDSQKLPQDFPTITEMIDGIKNGKVKGPGEMLDDFKVATWKGMNNHIHNGILSMSRHANSYPEALLKQILKSSNALNLMTAMVLARASQDYSNIEFVKKLQTSSIDVLPDLIPYK